MGALKGKKMDALVKITELYRKPSFSFIYSNLYFSFLYFVKSFGFCYKLINNVYNYKWLIIDPWKGSFPKDPRENIINSRRFDC